MKQHKWHKEIKAWADGAEIEVRQYLGNGKWNEWESAEESAYSYFCDDDGVQYRIKPQPKEPQYLYVHFTDEGKYILSEEMFNEFDGTYIGKIKLEVEDGN